VTGLPKKQRKNEATNLCVFGKTRADSLYRYNPVQNKLIPLFTLNFKNTDCGWPTG
jgi:hypothetical protein